ncbi:MAG: VWA-like domain-containing protein [Clostridia bacterium]|nr:VWA-like domain-containing protein [Clostridia bacterium]
MRIQDVMVNLLLKQPFYGYIAATVTPVESFDIPTVSMISTPSLKLLYNKSWYEALKDEQAVGVVIHELLHMVLLHPYRKVNRDHNLWTIACDMAVNEHIDPALLPANAITVEKIAKEIKETIPALKGAEFYYDIIAKTKNKISIVGTDREIKIVLRTGQELKANNSMESDSSEINKNAFKGMLTELVEQAEAEGEIPTGLSSFVSEIYKTSEINWRNVLKRFLSGKGKVLKSKTCKRESKRFENLPGNRRTVGTTALLALDESGSISEKQTARFYNELLAIRKITGTSISVTQFDTECTQPIPIEKYIREKRRVKNGGTDFRPIFHMADKMRIPLLIIFTDGDGTVPENTNQKVLWVLTKAGKKPAEYGHCITFDV